jgi:hypothetical protein
MTQKVVTNDKMVIEPTNFCSISLTLKELQQISRVLLLQFQHRPTLQHIWGQIHTMQFLFKENIAELSTHSLLNSIHELGISLGPTELTGNRVKVRYIQFLFK